MGLALRVNRSAPSETEQSLVAAVRSGDDGAFEELFSRYRDRISAYVHGAVGDHARAEDITQDVFISALRRMRDTERPISFKPWIYEIARNACIDEFRRTRRTSEVSLNEDGESTVAELQLASPVPPPDVIFEERQKLSNLQGAFGGLSENHHRILVMRELEGLSYGEIGKRLGMSRAMVESTLFRARKRLNQEFRELESGQRCERVRSAIDRSELGSPRLLGVRERRQVARHMAYCQRCRQYAWTAGFDASSLKRRTAAQRIAALLPVGWWAHAGGARHALRAPSVTAARVTARLARYSEPVSQVGLGRAAAAAAAIAFAAAGSGYVVAGSDAHHSVATKPAAVTLQPLPAHPTAVFIRASHAIAPAGGAVSGSRTSSSHRPRAHKAARSGAAHHGSSPRSGHAGAQPGSGAASAPGARSSVSSGSAGQPMTTSSSQGSGSHGLLGSLLGGGSSSSGTRGPGLPSSRSVSLPSASLKAVVNPPTQGAVEAANQAANAAKQVVDNAAQTVDSMGSTASSLVGGAAGLGGSRSGG